MNIRDRLPLLSIVLFVLIASLSSCTVTEDLAVRTDNTYASDFHFDVQDFFIAVLQDFNELSDENGQPPMDKAVSDFQTSLQRSIAASAVNIQALGDNAYRGTFAISDIQKLFAELGAGNNQTILRRDGTTMTFFLSIDNYDQLVPVIPFLADENFETFGPTYNQGMNKQDYLEMISFMLGEEGPEAIEDSLITMKITTPSDIISFVNGEKTGPREYTYSFPLIDFLLLDKPLTFTLAWK